MIAIRTLCAAAALALIAAAGPSSAETPRTSKDIIDAAPAADWRPLDLEHTLVMRFGQGRTAIIELAPTYAPQTVANILTLARAHYFDGLAITRVQDNFVTQWGDPDGDGAHPRSLGAAKSSIPAEFSLKRDKSLPFVRLPDRDGFAAEVGHSGGFPVARNGRESWLAHCYGMVGAGRGDSVDSGTGAELYAVIGQAPRQLDRNITLVGRVVQGMEYLSALPRGTGALGFYESAAERTPIESVQVASDMPGGGPAGVLEALRTDTATFRDLTEARRNRRDTWYKVPAGHIDVCSVLLPVRTKR